MDTHKLFFKLFVVMLLLLPLDSQTTPNVSPSLPPEDVAAVRALLELSNMHSPIPNPLFSNTDCDTETYSKIVTCYCGFNDNKTCRVTQLDFSNQAIEGEIPEQIGDLTNLTQLHLSYNKFRGSIPESFANLSKLEQIFLYNNRLEGRIPSVLQKMKSLKEIYLFGNFFSGTIPSQLDALPFLELLDLRSNLLSGEIPKQLGNISSLQYLGLSDNMLRGQIPDELGNITDLQALDLSDNMLRGQIPDELGNITDLQLLSLMNNEFSGTLPPSFKKWKSMDVLFVDGNNFSGKFPDDVVFSFQNLNYLSLTRNNFEAPLPKTFSALKELKYLSVTDLIGHQDSYFPDVSELTNLTSLTLRNCSLTGAIPDFIWKLPYLKILDLSFNKLTGTIPATVHGPLKDIYLRSNNLTGSLPKWLTKNRTLHVDVSENNFADISIPNDGIPSNINLFTCCPGSNISDKNHKWLQDAQYCPNETQYDSLYIKCGGNSTFIEGNHYEADVNPEGRSTFTLSDSKRWGYSSMGISYEDHYILNQTCNLAVDHAPLYQTARTAPISLKYYVFCLREKEYNVRLHFAEIAWKADQVDQVEGVKNRRTFDVKIQGTTHLRNFNIEREAKGVNKNVTKEFNVTVNGTLEVHLYWSGKGNYGPLISAISVSPVPIPPKKHKRLSTAAIAGIGASSLLCVILIFVLLWWFGWLGGKKRQGEELTGIELYPGGLFNFRQIKAATQNFDVSNKLGEGGFGAVYKGVLPNGTKIAVKQLSTRSRQGIREFVNEIGTISALQHPNLVRLMGCCAEDNQLLLIYEYMENNSLDHALFRSDEMKTRLTWPTRVNICLGIAKGLAFLHEESKLKIIHRDIKPTNILLDEDLNAKISDFGFAKLFEEEKTHVITRVAGTTGYMAPEYAMRGHLTAKADVYSFGVVMLEIISGKNSISYRPSDETVYLLDLAYVYQKQGNLLALVDPNLGPDYSRKKAATILELAMLCTNPSPTLRPITSEVVKILEGKSKIKTTSTNVPYSMDNFSVANNVVAALSPSPQPGNNPQREASGTTIYVSVNQEIEESSFSQDN